MQLQAAGIVDHLIKAHSTNARYCLNYDKQDLPPLGPLELKNFYGVFAMFAIGNVQNITKFLVSKVLFYWEVSFSLEKLQRIPLIGTLLIRIPLMLLGRSKL